MNTALSFTNNLNLEVTTECDFLRQNLPSDLKNFDENLLGLAGPLVVTAQDYRDEVSLI